MVKLSLRQAVTEVAERDPVVADLVVRHGPPRLRGRTSGLTRFATLAQSIVYQQLAGNAARAIHDRFVLALDGEVVPERILASSPDLLRSCGLSGAKAAALRDLAEKVVSGQVSLARIGRLPDEDVISQLVQIRGIGRWTAEMFLLFTLGRLDVWPVGDYGVRAGYASAWKMAEMPSPRELGDLGEPFRPYRSLVAWYCWRAADERKQKNGPAAPAGR
jgi:DNA-3-methyladenine glycosylase II